MAGPIAGSRTESSALTSRILAIVSFQLSMPADSSAGSGRERPFGQGTQGRRIGKENGRRTGSGRQKVEPSTRVPGDDEREERLVCRTKLPVLPSGLRFIETPSVPDSEEVYVNVSLVAELESRRVTLSPPLARLSPPEEAATALPRDPGIALAPPNTTMARPAPSCVPEGNEWRVLVASERVQPPMFAAVPPRLTSSMNYRRRASLCVLGSLALPVRAALA
jgi:hypothetical protein